MATDVNKVVLWLAGVAVALLAAGGLVHADMLIKLKSGQVHRLPVTAQDLESITFTEDQVQKPGQPAAVSADVIPTPGFTEDQVQKPEAPAAEAKPAASAPGQVIQVGPQRPYKTPSAAAQVATHGAIVEIDAGTYQGDVAVWRQHNLTLRGVGGRAHLEAAGNAAERKAIWVIKGNNATIENIEFSGAQVSDKNGAGIRLEGSGLTIRNSHFHHNEMGILTGKKPNSDILIEGSEFNNNTVDYERYRRLGHNIYIGEVRRFTLRNSYTHDAHVGHNVKSRARENYILYNRIMDEENGSSYLVDLSEGGDAYLIGNLFRQSPLTENTTLISFASEHNRDNPQQSLYVINNTFINDNQEGIFVNNRSVAPATLINNLFVGEGQLLNGPGEVRNSLRVAEPGFQNRAAYNYRLLAGSPAIDQGVEPGQAANGFALRPDSQYVHPLGIEPRPQRGPIDIGAYEFNGP